MQNENGSFLTTRPKNGRTNDAQCRGVALVLVSRLCLCHIVLGIITIPTRQTDFPRRQSLIYLTE